MEWRLHYQDPALWKLMVDGLRSIPDAILQANSVELHSQNDSSIQIRCLLPDLDLSEDQEVLRELRRSK